MSKFIIMCSLMIIALGAQAQDRFDPWNPGRPGRPERPERPGRPGPERPPGRVVYQVVGSFRVQKVIETTNTARVNAPNVKQIKLSARNNDVEIIEARLLLDNGREIYMDGITGGLGRDRSITYTLNGPWGERVRSVTVRAVTRSLVGSRADLEVSVGVLQ